MLLTPRLLYLACGAVALVIAIHFETGIGTTHVQGYFAHADGKAAKVLVSLEGADATVSAVEYSVGERALLINSATAAGESPNGKSMHYMRLMGSLPMRLQAAAKDALVICFGTGQTADAVRKENPQSIDVVDVNPNVFKLARYFTSNEEVLNDPRLKAIVMDGRAYLRRTQKNYDVITLEPMPPLMAGMNALYSIEFYQLARHRLNRTGIIAQWLPFHNVAPHYAASIVKTFIQVFPNAVLWVDPISKNGILLGSLDANKSWPRTPDILLQGECLQRYANHGEIIGDDNQLLAYGKALYAYSGLQEANFKLLRSFQ